MGGVSSKSNCKQQKHSTSIVPNPPKNTNADIENQTKLSNDDLLNAMESGTKEAITQQYSQPPPPMILPYQQKLRQHVSKSSHLSKPSESTQSTSPQHHQVVNLTPMQQLQRLQQINQNISESNEDVATSGPLLLRRLSLAAVQKEKQFMLLYSQKRRNTQTPAALLLPRDKLMRLSLRKYFRDADSKTRGYLTAKGTRKALSAILNASKLPNPPDIVTNSIMSYLGAPLSLHKKKKNRKKNEKNNSEATNKSMNASTLKTITKQVIKEDVFISSLLYGQQHDSNVLQRRPPILSLAASLVDMQYDQRIRYIDRLWKLYMIPRTKKMGYEELHEMLKHLAPEPRHMPTIDETCMFLGAIKRGSHFNVEEEEDILHLTVHEFAEYAMRGLAQTKKSKKLFSSRGTMQAKITRCLNAMSEEASEEHAKRRQSISRRPNHLPLENSLMFKQFAKMEGIDSTGKGQENA
jgi:hypothetical protein